MQVCFSFFHLDFFEAWQHYLSYLHLQINYVCLHLHSICPDHSSKLVVLGFGPGDAVI